jgi:uncharacterized protein (DUF2384 family)
MNPRTTVASIIEGLQTVYKPEGVVIWLTHRHRLLNEQRPVDMMDTEEGRREVYRQICALRDGAFV